jgi:hypothetical protein
MNGLERAACRWQCATGSTGGRREAEVQVVLVLGCRTSNPIVEFACVAPPQRMTDDLSAYPDLVVIYLGMRVDEARGLDAPAVAPEIRRLSRRSRTGCCCTEPHVLRGAAARRMRRLARPGGARSLTRTLPHRAWWSEYLRDRGGTVLARDLLPARRHRDGLRRHGRDDRLGGRRAGGSRQRPDAQRARAGRRGSPDGAAVAPARLYLTWRAAPA